MKLKLKYRFCLQLFAMALLLYSCSENEAPISDTTDNQARLNFLIKTAPTNKALIHGDMAAFPVWHSIFSIKQTSTVNIRN